MSKSAESSFIYVTFIRTTPERLWSALTDADQMKEYWLGMHVKTERKTGAAWQLLFPDGRIADTGEILELDEPRVVLKWRNEFMPEVKAEGYSLCTMDLEPTGDAVKLTITHTIERADSEFIKKVSGGWPKILSNLKSMLETGETVVSRVAS